MNKLLHKMMLKAEGYADDTDLPWLVTYTEKLAELIMQECAEVLAKVPGGTDSAIWYKYCQQFKKHFGVES